MFKLVCTIKLWPGFEIYKNLRRFQRKIVAPIVVHLKSVPVIGSGWLHGTVVECRSLAGELSLSSVLRSTCS